MTFRSGQSLSLQPMKFILLVLPFATLSFPMLACWIEFTGASSDLRPLLYQARLISWVIAFLIAILLFFPLIWRNRIKCGGAILFGVAVILIQYACMGFLTAHAEERVIQQRIAHRDPSDDMGPNYMYGEFSGAGYSRGTLDTARKTWGSVTWGLASCFLWLPIIIVGAHFLYPKPSRSDDLKL